MVAVVGDGALTGGMTWEALNNITDDNDRRLVIVVNDNGRSYAPTIGGMADYLASLRPAIDRSGTHRQPTRARWTGGKRRLQNGGPAGQFAVQEPARHKKGIKDWWAPQGLFETSASSTSARSTATT